METLLLSRQGGTTSSVKEKTTSVELGNPDWLDAWFGWSCSRRKRESSSKIESRTSCHRARCRVARYFGQTLLEIRIESKNNLQTTVDKWFANKIKTRRLIRGLDEGHILFTYSYISHPNAPFEAPSHSIPNCNVWIIFSARAREINAAASPNESLRIVLHQRAAAYATANPNKVYSENRYENFD